MKGKLLPAVLAIILLSIAAPRASSAGNEAEVATILAPLKSYDYGQSRKLLDALDRLVRETHTNAAARVRLESELVKLVAADTTLAAKQEICRRLAIIGTDMSVPALGRLLGAADARAVEAACYALNGQQSPAARAAVSNALSTAKGAGLVAIINLLGNQRDGGNDRELGVLARQPDEAIAGAAITALGKIATDKAIHDLGGLREKGDPQRQKCATLALLQAARELAQRGRTDQARSIYDQLAGPAEAIWIRRGVLLGRLDLDGADTTDLILSTLKGQDSALKPTAIAAIASVRDSAAIARFAAQLPALAIPEQVLMIGVLAGFKDETVRTALTHAAGHASPAVRAAALQGLGRAGDASCVPMLARIAASGVPEDAEMAVMALRTLQGPGINAAIVEAILATPAEARGRLIPVLGDRQATESIPALLEQANLADERASLPAIRALGALAGAAQLPDLLRLLATPPSESAREAAEAAVIQVAGRMEDSSRRADAVLAALKSADAPRLKRSLVRVLAAIGNDPAFQAVSSAMQDPAAEVREAALQALTSWPDSRALPALLAVVKHDAPSVSRTLALRGCLRILPESSLGVDDQARIYADLWPFLLQPEEKRLALTGLARVPRVQALQWAAGLLNEAPVRQEAEIAILSLTRQLGTAEPAPVNQALQAVIQTSTNAARQSEARALLRVNEPPRPDVYLDSLQPLKAVSGNDGGKGQPRINRNCIGQLLKLKGVVYERGVGEHASSELTFEIKPAYRRFVCVAGLDDQVARFNDVRGSIVVKVFADNNLLAQTPVLRGGGASANVDAALPAGAKALRLVVEDAGDGVDYDDADIVNAGFILADRPAAPAPQPQAAMDETGFTPLLDGHSFAGWEGNLGVFRIQDGTIVGGSLQTNLPHNEFLCTTNEYSDFELRLKFKLIGATANGGVQIRSRRVPNNTEVSGYQADLGQEYWGSLYDESRRNRTLAQANATELRRVLKPDDWNDYRIRCQGRRIQLWVNGYQTVDYSEPDPGLEQKGIIGLQIHGGPPSEARYREIRIQPLPAPER